MAVKRKSQSKIDLEKLSNDQIISFRIELEKELKGRGIKFSPGDIGEKLAIAFFNTKAGLDNLQKTSTGTKSVDAVSRKGDRYSIKTIKEGAKSGTIYPDPNKPNKQLFEYLLLALLDEEFELKSLHRFSWKQFMKIKLWDKTMNAWYVSKSKNTLTHGEEIYKQPGTSQDY
jgi:hypothetical protein